jgi:hypothetical protein
MGPVKVPLNVRNFLIMVAKNAVNAALLSAVQVWHDPQDNNFQNWHGIKGILWIVGSAVAAREAAILVPKVLKWSTTSDITGGVMKSIIVLALLLGSALSLTAQTAPPTTPPGYQFAVSGSYAASNGNATNNGMQNSIEYSLTPHNPRGWGVRLDTFGLNNPASTTLQLAEGQFKVQGSKLSKAIPNGIDLDLHAGLGCVKSPTGAMSFAAGLGMSADYNVSKFFFVRVLDVTYAYSRGLANNGAVLGNYVSAAAGIGFKF